MRQRERQPLLLSRLSRLPERTATLCRRVCALDPGSSRGSGRQSCRRSPERLQVLLSQVIGRESGPGSVGTSRYHSDPLLLPHRRHPPKLPQVPW